VNYRKRLFIITKKQESHVQTGLVTLVTHFLDHCARCWGAADATTTLLHALCFTAMKNIMILQNGCKRDGLSGSVPGREGQLLVLVRVIDGGINVHHDGVAACDFGGNVDGHHGEHGVPACCIEVCL
jgi:hypothetical protein